MNSEIMVSICCMTFNHAKYVRDALEGFVNQKTNFKYEVLIHDDASTDGTQDIIKEYEEKYPDIIKPIYQTENQYSQRVSIKKNFQIPRVKGKYVTLCEGDDYWTDPCKLQKQVDFLESHPDYTLCATACTWMNLRDNIEQNNFIIEKDMDIPVEDIILEKKGRIFPTVSIMVRQEIYTVVPEWFSAFSVGDIPLFINAGIIGKIRMLADNTCVYRWFASGSWTVSMESNDYRVNFKKRFITAFETLNKATNYKYDETIKKRIAHEEFTLAIVQNDWKKIRTYKNSDEWKEYSFTEKFNIFLACKFPKAKKALTGMYRKIRRFKQKT